MYSDNEKFKQALDNIGSNYTKALFVNLSEDTFGICCMEDNEYKTVKELGITKISEYWQWFCSSDLLHPDDKQVCINYKLEPNTSLLYRRNINGEWRFVYMEVKPCNSYSETWKQCVLYVKDVNNAYVREYENVVEKLGTTDSFTGLLNKTALSRDIEKNKDKHVGIMFADLNGLKWTNDNLGHSAGDELILKFAGLLSLNFGNCKCYHLSGDEFAVCCFGGSLHEFIKKSIAFHKSMWWTMDYPIASIGYSVGDIGEFQKAYDEAEKEMYDDKRIFYQRFPKYKRK